MRELLGLDLARSFVARGGRLVLSTSGGKDSTALGLALQSAGLPFTCVFADTGWEHPETYQYIRSRLPEILGQTVIEVRADVDLIARAESHATRIERRGGKSMSVDEAALLAAVIRSEGVKKAAWADHFEGQLGHYSAMVRLCLHKIMFPAQSLRWCTEELKVYPLARFGEEQDADVWFVQGIRREESRARQSAVVHETMPVRGAALADQDLWRPILDWLETDVIGAHHEAGHEPNRLYLHGASRVGCFPCIYARKEEIRRLGDKRIAFIAELEAAIKELFVSRLDRSGGAYSEPAWFQADRVVDIPPVADPGVPPVAAAFADPEDFEEAQHAYVQRRDGYSTHRHACVPVGEMYAWSKTERGGRTLSLFAPSDGCMKWGFCEHGKPPDVAE